MDITGVLLIVVLVLLLAAVVLLAALLSIRKRDAKNKTTSTDRFVENESQVKGYEQPFTVIKSTPKRQEQEVHFPQDVERGTVSLSDEGMNSVFGNGFENKYEKTAMLGGEDFSQAPSAYAAGGVIVQYYKNGAMKRHRLEGGCAVIGRDPGCDIVFDSTSHISKQHTLIFVRNGMPCIADLNSKNGTFVNEKRVEGIITLIGNESIKLASLEIKVYIA